MCFLSRRPTSLLLEVAEAYPLGAARGKRSDCPPAARRLGIPVAAVGIYYQLIRQRWLMERMPSETTSTPGICTLEDVSDHQDGSSDIPCKLFKRFAEGSPWLSTRNNTVVASSVDIPTLPVIE